MLIFFTLFRVHNNNSSIDPYNRDLQTTIILFTCNVFIQDWLNSFFSLFALYFLLYRRINSLMNALNGNLCKCCFLLFIYLIMFSLQCCCCMFTCMFSFFRLMLSVNFLIRFFILMFLLYFCLFVDHVSKLFFIILMTPFPFLQHYNI